MIMKLLKTHQKHLPKYLLIAVVLIASNPITTKAFDLSNSMFNQIYQQLSSTIDKQLNAATKYLNTYSQKQIDAWGEQANEKISTAISDSTGALGLPDIFKVKDTAKTVNNPDSTINISDQAVINAISDITNASSSSILSQDAQQETKQESERIAGLVNDSNSIVESVASLNNAAQNADSTQDVIQFSGNEYPHQKRN